MKVSLSDSYLTTAYVIPTYFSIKAKSPCYIKRKQQSSALWLGRFFTYLVICLSLVSAETSWSLIIGIVVGVVVFIAIVVCIVCVVKRRKKPSGSGGATMAMLATTTATPSHTAPNP